ncbi:MAG: hypothetical protein CHACPFDD_02552 [Phycisphaerae bacterium]|nr:hypothetical protein [Phycisphaerae bacterium]
MPLAWNRRPMGRDPAETKLKVEKWLKKRGHRLAYQAYDAFHRARLLANLATYVDLADGQRRKLDVCASYQPRGAGGSAVNLIRLACECRYSKDAPWVLLYGACPAMMAADWIYTPKSESLRMLAGRIGDFAARLEASIHFAPNSNFAYNIVRADLDDKEARPPRDNAYETLRALTEAAWALAEGGAMRGGRQRLHAVVIPCLVVNTLMAAQYNPAAGELEVSEVNFGRIAWQGLRQPTLVDVVAGSYLERYAQRVVESFSIISNVMAEFASSNGHAAGI